MLVPMPIFRRMVAGEVDIAFRRWKRPTVKAGGTLTMAGERLAIEAVERIDPATITDADAVRAGSPDADSIRAFLDSREGDDYRVTVRHIGPDPRIALRETMPSDDEIAKVLARFGRLGPWPETYLRLIAARPGVRAGDLADDVGRERLEFKADIRKLKALGLTESLPVGYRISPRGEAVLAAISSTAR